MEYAQMKDPEVNVTPAKQPTSIRYSQEAKRLLASTAKTLGISRSAALELAIRALAKEHGVR